MSSGVIKLKVITPQGLALEENISSVKLPASDGQIGVLAQHERYVSILGIGVVEFESLESKQIKKFVVSQGFCNVDDDTLILLADKVIMQGQIKREDLISERETVKLVLSNSSPDSSEWMLASKRLSELEAAEICFN
jgi:F-type H+-transporting ATPase subunit epsilon